jgi:hypothetical protein
MTRIRISVTPTAIVKVVAPPRTIQSFVGTWSGCDMATNMPVAIAKKPTHGPMKSSDRFGNDSMAILSPALELTDHIVHHRGSDAGSGETANETKAVPHARAV